MAASVVLREQKEESLHSGRQIPVTLSNAEAPKDLLDRFGKNDYRKLSGECGLLPSVGCL